MDSNIKYLKNGEFTYNIKTGLLGKGAFGEVYKGVITKTGQTVIKYSDKLMDTDPVTKAMYPR